MTSIILIRHGETAWNAARRLQGHTDIALNAEGERQAEALAAALAGERFDAIGAVVKDALKALGPDARLRERCYGAFEGQLYAEVARRDPEEWEAWQAREVDAVPPPGERAAESFRAFYERSLGAILDWAARHPGQSLALVAHGGVLECAYRAAHGMVLESPRSFPIRNASINRFRVADGKLVLDSWGEIDHLAKALDEL